MLLAATPVTYIPQYVRLYSSRSSSGVSLPATLLLALVAQAQVVQMYYLFAIHPEMRYGAVILKPYGPRDVINLAQIFAQWVCSVWL